MSKHTLANRLRARQRAYGLADAADIERLSDDEMIDCYNTCSDCGAKQLTPAQLVVAIARSWNDADFLARLHHVSHS